MFFGVSSPTNGMFTIHVYFNKEKPKIKKNDFEIGMTFKEDVKHI